MKLTLNERWLAYKVWLNSLDGILGTAVVIATLVAFTALIVMIVAIIAALTEILGPLTFWILGALIATAGILFIMWTFRRAKQYFTNE